MIASFLPYCVSFITLALFGLLAAAWLAGGDAGGVSARALGMVGGDVGGNDGGVWHWAAYLAGGAAAAAAAGGAAALVGHAAGATVGVADGWGWLGVEWAAAGDDNGRLSHPVARSRRHPRLTHFCVAAAPHRFSHHLGRYAA